MNLQKEELEKHLFVNDCGEAELDDEGWLWIEQKLKEAKIEENKLWVSKCKLNPLSSQEFLVAREAFEERIKKLSELKGEK